MHNVENIVAEVTFQFWEFLSIFGQFFALVAIFGHINIILQGYLNNHIFHTVDGLLFCGGVRRHVSPLRHDLLLLDAMLDKNSPISSGSGTSKQNDSDMRKVILDWHNWIMTIATITSMCRCVMMFSVYIFEKLVLSPFSHFWGFTSVVGQ